MRRGFGLLLLVAGIGSPAPAQAPAKPEFAVPHGYTRESANRKYLFVMRPPAGMDLAKLPRAYQAQSEELVKTYPTSGLYLRDDPAAAPVWTYSGPYAFDVVPANDGIHLVVIEGSSWYTSQFISARRLPPEEEQRQLDGPAISFYANGRLLKSHCVRDLVGDPDRLKHSAEHVQWRAGEGLVERSNRFIVYTQDAQRVDFDLTTGELLSKQPAARGATYYFAALMGASIVIVLLFIRWLVRAPRGGPAGVFDANPASA
jgi:hypothetical protein